MVPGKIFIEGRYAGMKLSRRDFLDDGVTSLYDHTMITGISSVEYAKEHHGKWYQEGSPRKEP